MKTLVLALVTLALSAGCRSEFRANDEDTSGASTEGESEGSGDAESGSGSEDGGAPTCGDCQDAECSMYAEICAGDPACSACLETPYSTLCANNEDFRRLAACSCLQCAGPCDYLCPAGEGACQACGIVECVDESSACAGDASCGPCLEDPNVDGCETSEKFDEFLGCACGSCGQACLWQCPDAYGQCAQCAVAECGAEYGACLMDTECSACSENPLGPGCQENELSVAVGQCVCANCDGDCGILFRCDELG